VVVAGVTGIVGANGTWVITVVNSTTFTLNGSVGIGVYTGGGEWHSPGPVYEDVAPGLLDESLARIALNPATAERAMILTESDRSVCQQYGENYFEHGYVAILAGVDPNAKRTFHRDSGISTN
jgi:hypothetical protein